MSTLLRTLLSHFLPSLPSLSLSLSSLTLTSPLLSPESFSVQGWECQSVEVGSVSVGWNSVSVCGLRLVYRCDPSGGDPSGNPSAASTATDWLSYALSLLPFVSLSFTDTRIILQPCSAPSPSPYPSGICLSVTLASIQSTSDGLDLRLLEVDEHTPDIPSSQEEIFHSALIERPGKLSLDTLLISISAAVPAPPPPPQQQSMEESTLLPPPSPPSSLVRRRVRVRVGVLDVRLSVEELRRVVEGFALSSSAASQGSPSPSQGSPTTSQGSSSPPQGSSSPPQGMQVEVSLDQAQLALSLLDVTLANCKFSTSHSEINTLALAGPGVQVAFAVPAITVDEGRQVQVSLAVVNLQLDRGALSQWMELGIDPVVSSIRSPRSEFGHKTPSTSPGMPYAVACPEILCNVKLPTLDPIRLDIRTISRNARGLISAKSVTLSLPEHEVVSLPNGIQYHSDMNIVIPSVQFKSNFPQSRSLLRCIDQAVLLLPSSTVAKLEPPAKRSVPATDEELTRIVVGSVSLVVDYTERYALELPQGLTIKINKASVSVDVSAISVIFSDQFVLKSSPNAGKLPALSFLTSGGAIDVFLRTLQLDCAMDRGHVWAQDWTELATVPEGTFIESSSAPVTPVSVIGSDLQFQLRSPQIKGASMLLNVPRLEVSHHIGMTNFPSHVLLRVQSSLKRNDSEEWHPFMKAETSATFTVSDDARVQIEIEQLFNLKLSLCADSMAFFPLLLSSYTQTTTESKAIKRPTVVSDIDVFTDVDEDAYVGTSVGTKSFESGSDEDCEERSSGSSESQSRNFKSHSDSSHSLTIKSANVHVCLHDGFDLEATHRSLLATAAIIRAKLERIRKLLRAGKSAKNAEYDNESVGKVMFNSVHLGLATNDVDVGRMDASMLLEKIEEQLNEHKEEDVEEDTWLSFTTDTSSSKNLPSGPPPVKKETKDLRLRGKRLGRSRTPRIEIHLRGISTDLLIPTKDGCSVVVEADIEVQEFEILDRIRTSTWRTFLSEWKKNASRTKETAISLLWSRVRPMQFHPEDTEDRLQLRLKPIRLHIDQDALDFLKAFFAFQDGELRDEVRSNPPYIQFAEVMPIYLKLDYKPKRVDYSALKGGKTIELMNFFHFEGSEIILRHICLSGVEGYSLLGDLLNNLWSPDVTATQIDTVLSGVTGVRSVVNVANSAADVVRLPLNAYRDPRDGRVLKALSKGATSLATTGATETLRVGARLLNKAQEALEAAEGAISGSRRQTFITDPVVNSSERFSDDDEAFNSQIERGHISHYANQPKDVWQGGKQAYASLGKNLSKAAQATIDLYEPSSSQSSAKLLGKALIHPFIGATEAAAKLVMGGLNSMDPSSVRDDEGEGKYKKGQIQ